MLGREMYGIGGWEIGDLGDRGDKDNFVINFNF